MTRSYLLPGPLARPSKPKPKATNKDDTMEEDGGKLAFLGDFLLVYPDGVVK